MVNGSTGVTRFRFLSPTLPLATISLQASLNVPKPTNHLLEEGGTGSGGVADERLSLLHQAPPLGSDVLSEIEAAKARRISGAALPSGYKFAPKPERDVRQRQVRAAAR